MKIETKTQLEHQLHNNAMERIKDRIHERMQERIKHHHHKNQIKDKQSKYLRTNNTNYAEHLINKTNRTALKLNKENIHHAAKITDFGEFPNRTHHEAMWDVAIDKWTRNWNFYREKLTESILPQLKIHHKRRKRQTDIELIESTGQNANRSATVPQDIFIEPYDCDVEEISNAKYYELNKISTCKLKPLDLDLTKTEVQLLSKE